MINIAIDGPSGAGKSTIAKAISRTLGYIYVDTGALYRAIGLHTVNSGKTTTSRDEIVPLLNDIKVELKFVDSQQRVFLNNVDVSNLIRTPEISMAASNVSAIPEVREFLFSLQKNIALENNVVMDGRDIGTVVLPQAKIKIFLTASPEARAIRRFEELVEAGQKVVYEDILEDIIKRDYNDSNREIAPLKKAEDAVLVDTTGNTLEQSIDCLLNIVKEGLQS